MTNRPLQDNSPEPRKGSRGNHNSVASLRGDLHQRFLRPSTYLLWALLLWFALPDASWSSSLPQAPLANLFGDQLLWFRRDPLAPSLWMVLWMVLPILALREAGEKTPPVLTSFATAALTWWIFWIPILVLAVLRVLLGADIPWAPAIAGFLGLLAFTSLLLALLFTTAELFGNPRTSWALFDGWG